MSGINNNNNINYGNWFLNVYCKGSNLGLDNFLKADENDVWVELELPAVGDRLSSYAVIKGITAAHIYWYNYT